MVLRVGVKVLLVQWWKKYSFFSFLFYSTVNYLGVKSKNPDYVIHAAPFHFVILLVIHYWINIIADACV